MNNEELKNLIQSYAKKYDVSSVESSLQRTVEQQSVKIGFLGAYSAGKTSLINSILGINLPVDISATTKSICMIVPTPGIEKNEYYLDDGQGLEKISISDFYSIVDGSKDGLAVIKTKPSSILPEGSVFVDTPGIDSVGTEIEQTFAYLQYVDAAVFCIKSLNGTVNHNVLEFLCRPEIQSMANHIVFALTHQDKVENEEAVRQEVVRHLRNIGDRLKIDNLEDKIFFVNGKDGDGNADLVYSFVKTHILNDADSLNEKRLNQNLKQIASQLKTYLEKLLANMKVDDSEIDKRQEEIENSISDLKRQIDSHRCSLTNLQQELQKETFDQLSNWQSAVASAESDQVKEVVDSMLNTLVGSIDAKVKRLLPHFNVPTSVKNAVGSDIVATMAGIDKKKDAIVTVSTAVLTAWLLPGGSVAANAAEATGGAVVKAAGAAAAETGKAVTKELIKQAGKEVVKQSGKEIVKQGVKEASKFAKFLGFAGKVIKDVNPLEHVGSFFAGEIKESSFKGLVANYSSTIAQNVVASLSDAFEIEIVRPLLQNLNDQKKALEVEEEKRLQGYQKFNEERVELETAIEKLSYVMKKV